MNTRPDQIEQTIYDCYDAQTLLYGQTLELAAGLSGDFESGTSTDDIMEAIRVKLQQVAVMENEMQAIKKQWKLKQKTPGAPLRQMMQRIQGMLQQLISHIDAARAAAEKAKKRLSPKLDHTSKGARMRSAYSSVASRDSR